MKAWLGTSSNQESLALHDLGEVILMSQESSFTPDEKPQRETRTLQLRVEVFEQTYQANRQLVDQIRTALRADKLNLKLKEDDHVYPTGSGQATVAGVVILNQEVEIGGYALPEDPNAAGTYNQSLTFTVRYEVVGLQSPTTSHLTITFTKNGGSPLTLGHVHSFRSSFRTHWYSEFRNIRDRSTGQIAVTGEWLADPTTPTDTRRADLLALAEAWESQINAKDGALTYGPEGTRFFDKTVKVEHFTADVNQACTGIKWSMDASYTNFPDEETYAFADYTVQRQTDAESGEQTMILSGTIGAASLSIATAKLNTIRTAVLAATGMNTTQRTSQETSERNIDADDGATFTELTFTENYRARASSILFYRLQVADADDTKSGILIRTYSGTVVASGSDATDAYNNAVAKARLLGDNKAPLRLNGRITRSDRQTSSTATVEHVSVDFSFEYQLKGMRTYLEMTVETQSDNLGESLEVVSGFIVARDLPTAQSSYASLVRNAYNGSLVRAEGTSVAKQTIQTGTYAPTWTANGGTYTVVTRLDFKFNVFRPKASGVFGIAYGISSQYNYLTLMETFTVRGRLVADSASLAAALARTAGNKIDELLAPLTTGKTRVSSERTAGREKVGAVDELETVEFNETYNARISASAQVISCDVSEEIQYSGTRWIIGPLPDGPSVVQNCGTEAGSRTITGNVVAATESAALAVVESLRQITFPSGVGGGNEPSVRYLQPPRITRKFDFLPLVTGIPRGGQANFQVVSVSFQFSEVLPDFSYNS